MTSDTIINLLNEINFCGLEGIRCGDALYFTIQDVPDRLSARGVRLKNTARIFRSILLGDKIKITHFGDEKVVFLFSNSYCTRYDYRVWFDKCVGLCKNAILIEPKKRKTSFKNLKKIRLIKEWHRSCVEKGIDRKYASLICGVLCDAYVDYCEIIRTIREAGSKLLVSLCDTHLIDSLVTQKANQLKMDTASLQHGHFESEGLPWVMSGSYSKYYLIYGEYVRKQFIKAGYQGKLLSVGMPLLIGESVQSQYIPSTREEFGVILRGEIDEDRELLKCAEILSERLGKKYSVKLHPGKGRENYGACLQSDNIKDIYYTEISALDFSNHIQFAVGGITTVFIDYIVRLFPMFVYRKAEDSQRYFVDIDWCMFHSSEQLYHLCVEYIQGSAIMLDRRMRETRDLLLVTQDVKGNYCKFLEKYDI